MKTQADRVWFVAGKDGVERHHRATCLDQEVYEIYMQLYMRYAYADHSGYLQREQYVNKIILCNLLEAQRRMIMSTYYCSPVGQHESLFLR